MENRKIGRLEVSSIGMGCMALSHGYGQIPPADYSIEAIRTAHDYGCTFFDTAEIYGAQLYYGGHNEQLLGKAVKEFRKDVVLATKLFVTPEKDRQSLENSIRGHLDKSLHNLETDYVDLYYLHRMQRGVPVEAVADVMGKLIEDGLIRGWGLSQVSAETLAQAHKVTPVTAVQNLYNILERDCETDIFPYCLEHNIGVVPFSPVGSGLLSGKITPDTQFEKVDDVRNWVPQLRKENIIGNQPIIDILMKYAKKKNATCAQIAIAWMLHKYPNVVPIPGSKNKDRIIENLGAWDVKFTITEFHEFESLINACMVFGHRGHIE